MQLSDIRVEVRTKNLERLGAVTGPFELEVLPLHNGVGTWTLTLPADHPLAPALQEPGAGIIVYDLSTGRTIMSGPADAPMREASVDSPSMSLTVSGVDDAIVLADMLAFPQPSNPDPTTQNVAGDRRTGKAEDLMHAYVGANIGPSAPVERRRNIELIGNRSRGESTTKTARFTTLLELLQELAAPDGLGFRVYQSGGRLLFETYEVRDVSNEVTLSLELGTLSSGKLVTAPPSVTRAIVAGEGLQVRRAYYAGSTPESLAAEETWGRRIEKFIPASGSSNVEYQQQALEALAEGGKSATALQIVPSDNAGARFGVDWYVGDIVGVSFADERYQVNITGAILKVGADGVRWGVTVGDDAVFSQTGAITNAVVDISGRLSVLERTFDRMDDTGWIPFPFESGFKNYGTSPVIQCNYRRIGNIVYLRGYVAPNSGAFPAGTVSKVGTLPVGFRPSHSHMTTASGGELKSPARLHVAESGPVNIAPPPSSASGYYSISTSFPID